MLALINSLVTKKQLTALRGSENKKKKWKHTHMSMLAFSQRVFYALSASFLNKK